MEGGGSSDGDDKDDDNDAQQLHKYKNHIICLFILQPMSCCGSHTTACKSMEYRHDIHGLDVLLCGEDGLSARQGLDHHANLGE